MLKDSKIYIAGHKGLVGSAIVRRLQSLGYTNLVYRSRGELELLNQQAVKDFFEKEKPEYVFCAAALVGGIMANSEMPARFIMENLTVQNNLIHSAYANKVKKFLFLGSSCIYPRNCPQPIKEECLLTGELETTNKAYAIAKIAGIITCQSYAKLGMPCISLMPTNLYGANDTYDKQNSHVIPALISKIHEAKLFQTPAVLWGTGTAKREFLFVDDLATACVFLMENYDSPEIINVGSGEEITIEALAGKIANVVGFDGEIVWDKTKPDGTPRKLLDSSKIRNLGWKPTILLEEGLQKAYKDFLNSYVEY